MFQIGEEDNNEVAANLQTVDVNFACSSVFVL